MAYRSELLNKYYHGICHKTIVSTLFRGYPQKLKLKNFYFFSTGRKNYYDILELTPKATAKDIKDAYYRLSKEYHPDLNKDDKEAVHKFREVAEAYKVLGNAVSRKDYDNMFRPVNQNLNKDPNKHYQPWNQRPPKPYQERAAVYNYDKKYRRQQEDPTYRIFVSMSFSVYFILTLFTAYTMKVYSDLMHNKSLAILEKKV